MPTTILHGESLEQARARRFAEEAYLGSEQHRLHLAMKLMNAIIDAGGEYPDACFKAAAKHNISYELLADAYDAADADGYYD